MLGDFKQFINTNFHGEEKEKILASFSQQQSTVQLNNQRPLDNVNSYGLCNNSTNFMIPNVFPNSNNNCVQLVTPIVPNSIYCEENFYFNQNNLTNEYSIDQQNNSAATILNQQQNAKQMNSISNSKTSLSASVNLNNNGLQKNELPNLPQSNHILNQNNNKILMKRQNSCPVQHNDKKFDLNKIIIQYGLDDSSRKVVYENVDNALLQTITELIVKSNKIDGLESNELMFPSDDEEAILRLLNPEDPIDREILIDNLAIKAKRIYFDKLKKMDGEKRAEMFANMARNKYKKNKEEREAKEQQLKKEKEAEEKILKEETDKSVQIARPQIYKNFNQRKNYQFDNGNVPKKLKPVPLEEKICFFCRNNGEPEFLYKTHIVRDPITNRTLCPVLRKYRCEICNATGDNSHTRSYCPFGKAAIKVKQIDLQSTNKLDENIREQNDLKANLQNPSEDQKTINSIIDNYRKEKEFKKSSGESKIENVVNIINQLLDKSNDENKENVNSDNKENINSNKANINSDMVVFSVKKKQIISKIDNKEN